MLDCERDVRGAIREAPHGSLRVLFDVREVVDYDLPARDVLIRIVTHLGTKAARTAFLADHALSRALALWIAHMGGGGRSSVLSDAALAKRWLNDVPEVSGVHPLNDIRETPEPVAK